jgi:hypothetical protein
VDGACRSAREEGRREGIEAAAEYVEEWDVEAPSALAEEIRALSPTPPEKETADE